MTEVALRAVIKGTGSALPRNRVSNAELANKVDTTDAWITERTGIKFRHIAAPDETTSSLAIEASRKALDAAGMAASDIDLIILATATPDQTFPASATIVQHALGCNGGVAFDVAAVCSGFLYAFSVAESMIRAGSAHNALVIGAETFSRILTGKTARHAYCLATALAPLSCRAKLARAVRWRPNCTPMVNIMNYYMSMVAQAPRAQSANCG